jgi:hypothetical protein
MLLLLACAASEYQHTLKPSEAVTGTTAEPTAPIDRPSGECGSVDMIGLDPCSTGEPLEVVVSGLELAARYDLAGSACIVEVGCDVPWLSLWIVTEEQACTWPGDGEHVDRLSSDRGYALCLIAAPEQPGDIGACWLQTTDQSYGVVVDNPVDNF